MGLLSRAAWLSAVAYFAVSDTEPLMEKDFTSSIMLIKWIWLRALHPLTERPKTPGAFGELLLQHTVVAESRCVRRQLSNPEGSPTPAPGFFGPRCCFSLECL